MTGPYFLRLLGPLYKLLKRLVVGCLERAHPACCAMDPIDVVAIYVCDNGAHFYVGGDIDVVNGSSPLCTQAHLCTFDYQVFPDILHSFFSVSCRLVPLVASTSSESMNVFRDSLEISVVPFNATTFRFS